jgi:hypothetical protein
LSYRHWPAGRSPGKFNEKPTRKVLYRKLYIDGWGGFKEKTFFRQADSVKERPLAFKFLFSIVAAAALAACPSGPAAAGPSGLDAALALWDQGDRRLAVGEAKRFLFHHPDHPRAAEARDIIERGPRASADDPWPPWGVDRPAAQSDGASGQKGRGAAALVRFYQKRLRTFRRPGHACPSYPSCSQYTVQAIGRHGALVGAFMYVDRSWREVTEANDPPVVWVDGRELHWDPLNQNDWWFRKDGRRP